MPLPDELRSCGSAEIIDACLYLNLYINGSFFSSFRTWTHKTTFYFPGRSTWPPNPNRMAESTFRAKSSSPRELNL